MCLLDNIKEVFQQRIKTYFNMQRAEETLKAKRDAKAKLEASNKQDKVPAAAAEIKDVSKLQGTFLRILFSLNVFQYSI